MLMAKVAWAETVEMVEMVAKVALVALVVWEGWEAVVVWAQLVALVAQVPAPVEAQVVMAKRTTSYQTQAALVAKERATMSGHPKATEKHQGLQARMRRRP